jgi:two-component system KDP operon response regulator KdpE
MPGMGGVEACRSIRRAVPRLPILMLTVMNTEVEKVLALDAGADDYITKPFRWSELTARLRSAVRRRNADDGIRIGEIELDPVKYRGQKRGRSIHLTPKEFEMLQYLMGHAGEPIPHARLLKSIWEPDYGNELEYLRTLSGNYARRLKMILQIHNTC